MVYTYKKTSDGQFSCVHCSKLYTNQNTMHYHMKTHEGKLPFECKTCSKQFLHASTLEIHRKAHHHVEHERVYKCPSEGCSFKGALSKGNLVIHYVRRHCHDEITKMLNRTETTFQCKECNKEMKSATAFHYHSVKCLPVLDSVRQKELETIIV